MQGSRTFTRLFFVLSLVLTASSGALASEIDLTLFGGIQRHGKLTFQSAPGTASNLIRTINSTNFGTFGARISHGGVFGGEHTIAYSSNFVDADTHAVIYNSNLLIQAPTPIVRPYGTVGLGLIGTSGG